MRTLITNGYVIDGLGREGPATVVIHNDVIEAVSWGTDGPQDSEARILDATGLVVAPGFIDMHAHDDVAVTDPEWYQAKIRQGITTTVMGLDGLGYAPVDPSEAQRLITYWAPVNGQPGSLWAPNLTAYRRCLEGRVGMNVLFAIPHGNVRIRHHGWQLVPVNDAVLTAMVKEVERGLEEGAYGLSTGLGYVPALAADARELGALASALRRRSAIYASHLRSYGPEIFAAIDEALDLARRYQISVHVSHLHLSHPSVFGQAEAVLQRLAQSRQQGLSVTFDLYPYSAGSSILHSYLPSWLLDGGPDRALARLEEEATLHRLRSELGIVAYPWEQVVIGRTKSGNWIGSSVAEAARRMHMDEAGFMAQLLREEALDVGAVVHQTSEADDVLLAEDPSAVVGSDGIAYGQKPHPRYYGAFAAFYDRHVRQRKRMTIAEAVAKMSTRTANILHLDDRGRVAPGQAADLVVFDPDRYRACSTYEAPREFAEGVVHVLINGCPVYSREVFDDIVRAGRVIAL